MGLKYADYVKNGDPTQQNVDQVEAQITEPATPPATDNVPERFKGKTREEIAQSYVELEKLASRQAQDVGRYRKLSDELLALELQNSAPSQAQPTQTKPLTVDDLYENADANIRRVAREETNDRVAALERELQQARFERQMTDFTARHPDWQERVKDPAFINWVQENPYRNKLAQSADRGDLDAADILFGLYKDLKGKQKQSVERTRQRDAELDSATLESSGPVGSDPVDVYSRSELLEKRIMAKNGDPAATRWMNANADKIAIAYAEGRIVD